MKFIANDNYGKIEKHIKNNLGKYILLLIIFAIGIIVGGMCFSVAKNDIESMQNVKEIVEQIMTNFSTEKWTLINKYFTKDVIKIILLVIISSSMIGLPLLLIWILYDGITLSFTISFLIYTYGILKGNLLSMFLLFIPNITSLIANMIITVSSVKLINNLFKMKKALKMEMIRHLVICVLAIGIIETGFLCNIFLLNFVPKTLNI